MKCKNCGSLIPDQSTFCPYCGVPLEEASYQPQPPAAISQPTLSYIPPVQQPASSSSKPKKAKGKVQKCPKCGALLSKKEKICSICGEAMPKKPRSAKAAIISMSVVICLLLCSTVYFMLEMFEGNRAIDKLNEEITSYSEVIEKLNSELATQTRQSESWKRHYQDLKLDYNRMYAEASFFHDYAVIVGNSNRYYHSYNCAYLDTSYFYIYNIENAKYQGYRPCPHCQ